MKRGLLVAVIAVLGLLAYWLLQSRVPNAAAVAVVGVGLGVSVALLLASFWPTK